MLLKKFIPETRVPLKRLNFKLEIKSNVLTRCESSAKWVSTTPARYWGRFWSRFWCWCWELGFFRNKRCGRSCFLTKHCCLLRPRYKPGCRIGFWFELCCCLWNILGCCRWDIFGCCRWDIFCSCRWNIFGCCRWDIFCCQLSWIYMVSGAWKLLF